MGPAEAGSKGDHFEFKVTINSKTTTSQKCEAVPRRVRMQGSYTFASLNSRLESNREEEEEGGLRPPERSDIARPGRQGPSVEQISQSRPE